MDNDDLVSVLDSYGEDMLRYLDANQNLHDEAVHLISDGAEALLAGRTTWAALEETDWHALTDAFVYVYGLDGLYEMRLDTSLGEDFPHVTDDDRRFLNELLVSIDLYLGIYDLLQGPES